MLETPLLRYGKDQCIDRLIDLYLGNLVVGILWAVVTRHDRLGGEEGLVEVDDAAVLSLQIFDLRFYLKPPLLVLTQLGWVDLLDGLDLLLPDLMLPVELREQGGVDPVVPKVSVEEYTSLLQRLPRPSQESVWRF